MQGSKGEFTSAPPHPGAHFLGVAFVVEEDKAADPIHIGLLGAVGIMLEAHHLVYPVQ